MPHLSLQNKASSAMSQNFYHSTVRGVRSSILHSHLKFHRNFLNWGGGGSEKNVQSTMYFWSNSLSNAPTPLTNFVGYSNRLKPSVFFYLSFKNEPQIYFSSMTSTGSTPVYTSCYPTCLVQQLQHNFFQCVQLFICTNPEYKLIRWQVILEGKI
jgi:hypothetical protein